MDPETSNGPETFLNVDTTNAYAEHFFNIKKIDKGNLKMPMHKFIKKCWEDQRGLRRQFLNELLVGMNTEAKQHTKKSVKDQNTDKKRASRSWKSTVNKLCKEASLSSSEEDNNIEIHTLEESWSKKPNPNGKNKRHKKAGTYQQPPKHSVHFVATQAEKDVMGRKSKGLKKDSKKVKRELNFDQGIEKSYSRILIDGEVKLNSVGKFC